MHRKLVPCRLLGGAEKQHASFTGTLGIQFGRTAMVKRNYSLEARTSAKNARHTRACDLKIAKVSTITV